VTPTTTSSRSSRGSEHTGGPHRAAEGRPGRAPPGVRIIMIRVMMSGSDSETGGGEQVRPPRHGPRAGPIEIFHNESCLDNWFRYMSLVCWFHCCHDCARKDLYRAGPHRAADSEYDCQYSVQCTAEMHKVFERQRWYFIMLCKQNPLKFLPKK
jgi:hypothetical protein